MKKLLYLAVILFTVFVAAGCTKVDENFTGGRTEKVSFVASFADRTRTSYQGEGKVDWVSGDLIRYYSKKNGPVGEYEVVRDGHSANVVADVSSGTEYVIAAYGGTGITDNSVNSFTINGAVNAEQSGKFEDAHVSVAKAFDIIDGASLSFNNITSMVKFSLSRTDVAYMVFTANGGEKLHGNGKLQISFNADKAYASFGSDGGSSIKINVGGAGTFYMSTLPVTLANGFNIVFYGKTGNKLGELKTSRTLTVGENDIVNIGTLDSRIITEPPFTCRVVEDFSIPYLSIVR